MGMGQWSKNVSVSKSEHAWKAPQAVDSVWVIVHPFRACDVLQLCYPIPPCPESGLLPNSQEWGIDSTAPGLWRHYTWGEAEHSPMMSHSLTILPTILMHLQLGHYISLHHCWERNRMQPWISAIHLTSNSRPSSWSKQGCCREPDLRAIQHGDDHQTHQLALLALALIALVPAEAAAELSSSTSKSRPVPTHLSADPTPHSRSWRSPEP